MNGVIFDIKEGAVHDGPGIRQTVFLKGCPLRCQWCHNPEGLRIAPDLLVSLGSCTDCGKCRTVCPHPGACTACGRCVTACPQRLRKVAGETLSAEELARRLARLAPYYASCGGGVTFSGGEPLMQPEFVLKTLSLLGPDVHTALETSGYGQAEVFRAFMEAFDLVMLDLKAMDDGVHRRYTGVSNRTILENAALLKAGNTPFIIRIPVIPGVNDTLENYRATARFLAGAPALCGVELLPYHATAGAKYAMLGKDYQPDFATAQAVRTTLKPFEEYGIRSCIL